jgi:hypothetical protein
MPSPSMANQAYPQGSPASCRRRTTDRERGCDDFASEWRAIQNQAANSYIIEIKM